MRESITLTKGRGLVFICSRQRKEDAGRFGAVRATTSRRTAKGLPFAKGHRSGRRFLDAGGMGRASVPLARRQRLAPPFGRGRRSRGSRHAAGSTVAAA